MTESEQKAIEALETAFKEANKLGLSFAGMDDSIIYITRASKIKFKDTYNKKRHYYNPVSDVFREAQYEKDTAKYTGVLNTSGAYIDSGGW